jgi:proline-specific peptidase
MERSEGFIDVGPGRVWYEACGEGPGILLLHGGPGASSDYLAPLMSLAEDGYQVVRYDQLGSWHSDKPDDISLWNPPRFVEEVETVRRALGLGRIHLVGQSWGSFLALDYALSYGAELASLTLYSGAASTRQCVAGMNRLRNQLPPGTVAMMARCEAEDLLDDPAYVEAVDTLYRRHLCRVQPYPEPLAVSMSRMAMPVYQTMWGPNEFTCTGTLIDWDVTDRLGEVRVPTLILCGRYDEVVPECSETMHAGIVGSQLVIFEHSSHLAHFEEPERFRDVLRGFLRQNETRAA